jgi:alpha/beta hydrolase family protein
MFRLLAQVLKFHWLTFAFALIATTMTSAAWAAVSNPTVTGPITTTCNPNCPSPPGPTNGIHVPIPLDGNSNLAEFIDANYVEEEFFFSGTATAYQRDPSAAAWDSTGFWTAQPSTTIAPMAYESRMLVRKPADPSKFNGIVIVEWLNVTAGVDLAPDYGYAREELLRDGFIWVGVSAQSVSVNGGFPAGFGLKSYDPVRYGPLVHPGDNYCYDIYSQAAQAIRHPMGVNPLGDGYLIRGMIADGESQSASRMVTYYNAIEPLAQLFDGTMIHSRSGGGAGLFSGTGGSVPSPSMLRTDQTPVLVFETETDTVGHFAARQPDSTTYRLWEGTGTAHADSYDVTYFGLNTATQEPFYPPTLPCAFPQNTANERYLMDAAMLHLSQWINGGTPPPSGQPIDVVGGVIQRDSLGIALDGIRLPEMDVPTVTQQGTSNPGPGFCILFGREIPLPVTLQSLYANHGKYVSKFAHATNILESNGFLLEPDAEAGQSQAAQSAVP